MQAAPVARAAVSSADATQIQAARLRPPRRGFAAGAGEGDEPPTLPTGGPLALHAPEAPPVAASPALAAVEAAVDRVLVAQTPGPAEVRLGVNAGALAGVEVRLVAAPQGIEIAFLAADAGTRRQLAVVADELRRRLEARGRRVARVDVTPHEERR